VWVCACVPAYLGIRPCVCACVYIRACVRACGWMRQSCAHSFARTHKRARAFVPTREQYIFGTEEEPDPPSPGLHDSHSSHSSLGLSVTPAAAMMGCGNPPPLRASPVMVNGNGVRGPEAIPAISRNGFRVIPFGPIAGGPGDPAVRHGPMINGGRESAGRRRLGSG